MAITPVDSDSRDRVADHFKCIVCVIAHSLAPPLPQAAPVPVLVVIGHAEARQLSAPAPRSSHSIRGPLATPPMYGVDAAGFNRRDHAKTDANPDGSALSRYEPSAINQFELGPAY